MTTTRRERSVRSHDRGHKCKVICPYCQSDNISHTGGKPEFECNDCGIMFERDEAEFEPET